MSLRVELDGVTKVYPLGQSAGRELAQAIGSHAPQKAASQGKAAVDGVSLVLSEGDRLGIVGRNGAGKSTLLHMIAGISEPSSGSIRIQGKVTSILTLGVGLRDDLSGRENIYVDGEIQGKSRAEIDLVVPQVVEFADIGKAIDYPVRTYSTGMKARLAFSMITHIDPEILIIDEALAVGDAAFAAKAGQRLLDICARGKIVILVSHGMKSVRDICNRCIYLKDGRIQMDGDPEAVIKAYIDEVRGEDEAALLERFAAHAGSRSHVQGYAVQDVALWAGQAQAHAARIEARERVRLRIRAIRPPAQHDVGCVVRIVRLDDLLLFEREFAADEYALDEVGIGLEVEFSPLPLAPAIYRLDVELLERDGGQVRRCAESSLVFEVYALATPDGGKPMLYYPVAGSALPVAPPGECSRVRI